MPRTATIELFEFAELSVKAKVKARDWYREGAFDNEWWDFVYEDAIAAATILGIAIGERSVPWRNASTGASGTHTSPTIYFSGFSSQGDGACFEGTYAFRPEAAKEIREYAPQDEKLYEIADELAIIHDKHGSLNVTIKQTDSRYSHEYTTSINVESAETGDPVDEAVEKRVAEIMRMFMKWIYRQLEQQWDHINSDESIDEAIIANEYEFNEDGSRAIAVASLA